MNPTCQKCNTTRAQRDLVREGVALCGGCYRDVRPGLLKTDRARLQRVFAGVAGPARKLEWNEGRWSSEVEIEDGFWKVDLHGLNAKLADRAMNSLVRTLPRLGVQRLRVVVGKGGKGVLEDIALRALARSKGLSITDGDGWIDAVWGGGTELSLLRSKHPDWVIEGTPADAASSVERLLVPSTWSVRTWAAALVGALAVGLMLPPAAPVGFVLGALLAQRRG